MSEMMIREAALASGIEADVLRKKFLEQLAKDFEMSGCGADFLDENLQFSDLPRLIEQKLKSVSGKSLASLESLLYRVDVTERMIAKEKEVHPGENESGILAGIIIKRILQKIIFKIIYSK